MNNDNNPKFQLMNTRMGLIGTEYKTEDLKDIPGEFGIFLDVFFFDNVADDDCGNDCDPARYNIVPIDMFNIIFHTILSCALMCF